MFDHGPLLVTQRRSGVHGGGHGAGIGGEAGSSWTGGESDHPGLGGENLRCRPSLGGQRHGLVRRQVRLAAPGDLVETRPLAGGSGARTDGIPAHEAGVFVGERRGQLDIGGPQLGHPWHTRHPGQVEAEVAGAPAPFGAQLGLGDPGGLGLAGGQRGQAGGLGRMAADPLHLGHDLGPTAGERLAHLAADAHYLGHPVTVHLVEHEAQPGGQLPAQAGLEHGLTGVALAVQGPGVEGGATTVGALGHVEHGPVQVDARVAEPAGAVQEDCAHEAGAGFMFDAGVAPTHQAGVGLQVALDLVARRVERCFHLGGVVVAAEGPDERHRLRRRQRQVEAGDLTPVDGHGRTVGGLAPEGGGQGLAIGDAGQAVGGGQATDPASRRRS